MNIDGDVSSNNLRNYANDSSQNFRLYLNHYIVYFPYSLQLENNKK